MYIVLHHVFKLLADGKIQFNKKHETKIKKHGRFIQSVSKLNSKTIKAKLIRQKGGSLAKVLTTILPIIGAVVKSIL